MVGLFQRFYFWPAKEIRVPTTNKTSVKAIFKATFKNPSQIIRYFGRPGMIRLLKQCQKNWGRGLSPQETIFLEDTFPYFVNYCCNRRLQSPSKNATFMFKTLKPVKKLQSWIASLAVFGRKVRILCNHIHLKISTAFPF